MKQNDKFPLMDEEMIQQAIFLLKKKEERDFHEVKDLNLRGKLLLQQNRINNLSKREKIVLKGRLLIEQERIRNLTKEEKMILKGRLLVNKDNLPTLTKEDQMLYILHVLSGRKLKERYKAYQKGAKRKQILLENGHKNKRLDRITKPNKLNELVLPIAHYAIIDLNNPSMTDLKIKIYGLGSCIALILCDKVKKIHAMSHIYLPKSSVGYVEENFPQKHADTAVPDLLNQILKHGAKKEHVKAYIFGGTTKFKNAYSDMGKRNTECVKRVLKSLDIKIEKDLLGGTKGSTIIYDVKNNLVSLLNLNKNIKI